MILLKKNVIYFSVENFNDNSWELENNIDIIKFGLYPSIIFNN